MNNISICRPFSLLALCSLIVSSAMTRPTWSDEPSKPDTASKITEVTLQRRPAIIILQKTRCFGRCPDDKVILKSDGTAEYSATGSTKLTGDFTGTFWKDDFTRLAQWLESEGVLGMKDSYGEFNPTAPNEIVSIVRNGQRKTIANYAINFSMKLWGVGQAIRGVASDIKWQPVQSGLRGNVVYKSKTFPDSLALSNGGVVIRVSGAQVVFSVKVDESGNFEIPLLPGTYIVTPFTSSSFNSYQSQEVIVHSNQFSNVTMKINKRNAPRK